MARQSSSPAVDRTVDATAPDVARWGFFIGARGGVMVEETPARHLRLPDGMLFVPVARIAGIVGNALQRYVEALERSKTQCAIEREQEAGCKIADPRQRADDEVARALFKHGFEDRSTGRSVIRTKILQGRSAGLLTVREIPGGETPGRGAVAGGRILDDDVERGCLSRDDFERFVHREWPCLADEREDPGARRSRRLARLRELGADWTRNEAGNWCANGTRGALAQLAREEAAAGRPMSTRQDVSLDLTAAADADQPQY